MPTGGLVDAHRRPATIGLRPVEPEITDPERTYSLHGERRSNGRAGVLALQTTAFAGAPEGGGISIVKRLDVGAVTGMTTIPAVC